MIVRRDRGFTLAELMVVILVIGLIVAIALPFFQRAFAVQRRVVCAGNLEKLGQAYNTRIAQGSVAGVPSVGLDASSWPITLMSWVGRSKDVFICPETDASIDFQRSIRDQLREIYIEVFSGPAGNYGNWLWNVPLDESYASEWVWRLSEEQFAAFMASPNYGQGYKYPGYQPGRDPTTYWFVFEDQGWKGGGDKDYFDELLKVHVTDTEIVLTPQNGQAGYNFSLAMGKGAQKKVLVSDMKQANGVPYTLKTFVRTYYGMNSMSLNLLQGSRKLLIIDYEKTIARGSDYDDPDEWLEDEELFPVKAVRGRITPKFFRHFDQANMLSCDGAVRPKSFQDITIYDDQARREYWNPDLK